MRAVADPTVPLTIYYAFKQAELDGVAAVVRDRGRWRGRPARTRGAQARRPPRRRAVATGGRAGELRDRPTAAVRADRGRDEKARDEVVQRFSELYAKESGCFPSETKEKAYLERIRACYPMHPELFDRLFEDWSTLEKFQRTRGVLKLMAAVVHALWERQDPNLLILPAAIPLDLPAVLPQLTQYLDENWMPIIESDVDGPELLPLRYTFRAVARTRATPRAGPGRLGPHGPLRRAAAFARAWCLLDGRHPLIATGAGSMAVEITNAIEAGRLPPLGSAFIPVGDGALITGVGTWLRHASPATRIVGVQSEAAPAMALSSEGAAAHRGACPVVRRRDRCRVTQRDRPGDDGTCRRRHASCLGIHRSARRRPS